MKYRTTFKLGYESEFQDYLRSFPTSISEVCNNFKVEEPVKMCNYGSLTFSRT